MLGRSLDAMVFDPVPWNRRDIFALAVVNALEQPGGIVTKDSQYLYYPHERAASAADLEKLTQYGRAVAEVAEARGKPYALTETGTYRLHLLHRVSRLAPGASLPLYSTEYVSRWLAALSDPALRSEFLANYGIGAASDIALSPAEVTSMFPNAGRGAVAEDWYNTQLLELTRRAGFAYALTWQTYFDGGSFDDKSIDYEVPFPGHPEEDNFRRFAQDPAVCFDGAACQQTR